MTADCVPILFCNNEGTKVAAIHAGWKGICMGIIENAIELPDGENFELHKPWMDRIKIKCPELLIGKNSVIP